MLLTVEKDSQRDMSVLRLTGRLDGTESNLLRTRVNSLLSSGTETFVLDLGEIDFINEIGIGDLAGVTALVRARGRTLFLTEPPKDVSEFFEVTGTAGIFDFRDPDGLSAESIRVPDAGTGSQVKDRAESAQEPLDVKERSEEVPSPRYIGSEAFLEVIDPILGTRSFSVSKTPFLIGRGPENDLHLLDRRVSRRAATILQSGGTYLLKDQGNRSGIFLNRQQVTESTLEDGDEIDFGLSDSSTLVFHRRLADQEMDQILVKLDEDLKADPRARALHQMGLLLEASALVHSHLPMEEILASVVDRAIELTGAERGALLECKDDEEFRVIVARRQGAQDLPTDQLQFLSETKDEKKTVKRTKDLTLASTWRESRSESEGQSLTRQMMWCCLPLFTTSGLEDKDAAGEPDKEPKGALYLETDESSGFKSDSPRSRSQQEQILQALAIQAAGVLTNARLVEREIERAHLHQELEIARRIQQALLPARSKNYEHAEVIGINRPCYAVGGDYFLHMELGADRLAFIIADVCGKGLGAALVTTMLQGTMSSMTLGSSPADLFHHTNRFMVDHAVGRHVTLFFCTLSKSGKFLYINAGHNPPFLLRNGEITQPFTDGCPPFGLFHQTQVVEGNYQLNPGDTIVLYTDGIPEAMNRNDEEYEMERFVESIRRNTSDSISMIQDKILEDLDRFTAGQDPSDDVTMMIFRYTG